MALLNVKPYGTVCLLFAIAVVVIIIFLTQFQVNTIASIEYGNNFCSSDFQIVACDLILENQIIDYLIYFNK